MGQQQLLLLVLGIVIVGLAVVVGINAFGENQKRANADAMVNDALRIASDIQAYALKPEQFGGAGGFSKITVNNDLISQGLGYTNVDDSGNYSNVNGTFSLSGDSSDGVLIRGINDDQDNLVLVRVCGVTSQEITTAISYDPESSELQPDDCDGDSVDPVTP